MLSSRDQALRFPAPCWQGERVHVPARAPVLCLFKHLPQTFLDPWPTRIIIYKVKVVRIFSTANLKLKFEARLSKPICNAFTLRDCDVIGQALKLFVKLRSFVQQPQAGRVGGSFKQGRSDELFEFQG